MVSSVVDALQEYGGVQEERGDGMKGYKGMDEHMKCRGMQYEVGKTYHADGDINVCSNGLHFCKRLKDVFDHYGRDGNRFFEVEASGTVKTEERKSAASDLRIIRELNDIEINRTVYGDGYGNGYDNGYGYGNGNGYGYGYGNGYGYDNGYGYGNGYGYDNGYGYGYGYGNGNIQRILMFA